MDWLNLEVFLNPGSTLMEGIADKLGLPVDHLNFVASELVALALAPVFRTFLHPSVTKPATRQKVALVVGIYLGYFAFGIQALHLAGLPTLCYLIIITQNAATVQRKVMVVSLAYLSLIHLHRLLYEAGNYALDVTGPLMVMTQKATSLAFCIHDGFKKENDLTRSQKYYAVRKIPSILEYFSYMLQFHTLMVGPLVFYRDYDDFIKGSNLRKDYNKVIGRKHAAEDPTSYNAAFQKIITSILCACVFTFIVFPIERAKSEEFMERNISYQMLYLIAATSVVRFKYYHAWVLADAICNLSGLGFNGYTENGTPKWDLVSNVDILGFEFSSNLRNAINSWNKGTNAWLRMVAYERVKSNGVLYTFALSALWHGFYPGYYLTFATGALFTVAARSIRSNLRPHFQSSRPKKIFYDILTVAGTRLVMGYLTFSFVLLEFWPSVRIYWNMYFWLHLMALASIYLLPRFLATI
uniref:Putative membrane protein n=1 Tax=Rhodnius prolixus TaxID=13249 RepID=A0A4P6D767_RHOPR